MFNSISPAAPTTAAFLLTLALVLTATQPVQAQTFQVLYSFTGGFDGTNPSSGVLLGPDGSLYGNTLGNPFAPLPAGYGTAFKLTNTGSGWTLSTLYSFTGGMDGAAPAGMTFAPDGSLYGVTQGGGIQYYLCLEGFPYYGCGTVFKLTPSSNGSWTQSVLYRFEQHSNDGWLPIGPPVLDASGNVYGTTIGSPYQCGQSSDCGTAYQLALTGTGWIESVIFQFGSQGFGPNSLVFDSAGNLYGTTSLGGLEGDAPPPVYNNGNGVAFELTPSSTSWNETVLHNFNQQMQLNAGENPSGGLIFDHSGNLYGVTLYGGTDNAGTVYELARQGDNWAFQTLYNFQGHDTLGGTGSLAMDAAGNLYGVRSSYSGNYGTVFKLTNTGAGWVYSVLHEFTNPGDGTYVPGVLTLDAEGNLYGTAQSGGAHGHGVVWEIMP